MSPLKPWIHYLARRAGIPGMIGMAALVAAPAYYLTVIAPQENAIPALRAEYSAASRNTNTAGEVVRTRMTRQDRVENFHTFFPQQKHALSWMSVLYKAAEKENLHLAHGEYRPTGQPGKQPAQLQILLPVTGNYGQIRRFISSALAEIPFLALDEIDFQRGTAGGSSIEAKIRFTMYLRDS